MSVLWSEIERVCRLDEPDPVAAWEERMQTLSAIADRLTDRRFDSLHFHGGGTDLTVGLLASSRFVSGPVETAAGIIHRPNIPSEEVFTTPDPERVEGVVRSTRPLDVNGSIVRGLRVRFEGGIVVAINADQGADVLRSRTTVDEGARRSGEVALVDRASRVGQLGTIFYETLLDENAASHLALGAGFDYAVDDDDDREAINRSEIHIDFMIGSNDVDVTAVERDGARVPILRSGSWQYRRRGRYARRHVPSVCTPERASWSRQARLNRGASPMRRDYAILQWDASPFDRLCGVSPSLSTIPPSV